MRNLVALLACLFAFWVDASEEHPCIDACLNYDWASAFKECDLDTKDPILLYAQYLIHSNSYKSKLDELRDADKALDALFELINMGSVKATLALQKLDWQNALEAGGIDKQRTILRAARG